MVEIKNVLTPHPTTNKFNQKLGAQTNLFSSTLTISGRVGKLSYNVYTDIMSFFKKKI